MVADAWEHVQRTRPCTNPWRSLFGDDRRTYRERLDAWQVNYAGERIPRIDIVRHNLAALKAGNTMTWRGLDVRDRRQSPDRRRS